MTQQLLREIIVLVMAVSCLARSIYPKPILEKKDTPYKNQVFARLGLVAFGLFGLLVWYGIFSEGRPVH